MPINSENEQLLSLKEAAGTLPKHGSSRVHVSTVYRWCVKGTRGIHLEYLRLGARIFTTRAALDRFGNRLAELDLADAASYVAHPLSNLSDARTPAQEERAVTQAKKELDDAGVL